MNDAPPDNKGLDAFWNARADVQAIILAQAGMRVQAAVTRMDSLNQRLSALCALMFAGAAVAAQMTTNGDKAPRVAIVLAGAAACLFAAGGVAGFIGLLSKESAFPGESPSWWLESGPEKLAALDKVGAEYWVAGQLETVTEHIVAAVNRRGRAFNRGVALGAAAGILIALAAVTTAIQGPPSSKPSYPTPHYYLISRLALGDEVRLLIVSPRAGRWMAAM